MFAIRQLFKSAAVLKNPAAARLSTTSTKLCNLNVNAGNTHRVNELEKKFLVWTKKYPSIKEVPDYVSQDVMERARNRMRIRIANVMMVLTALACLGMVISGKKAAARGESVQQMNLDWHSRLKEQEVVAAASKEK